MMRIGLIGCGRIAQAHMEVFPNIEGAEVVAVCDTNAELARGTAEEQSCAGYSDFAEMLKKENLDAVVLATPPANHAQTAIACLESGLHVLCEKPLALTVSETANMYEVARERGKTLMLASKFRHMRAMIKAKAQLSAGLIGRPILFLNRFSGRLDMSTRWNSDPAISGGGVLIDNGTHSVDIARYLLGPVTRVTANAPSSLQKLAVEDTVVMNFEAGEVAGTVQLSWSLDNVDDPFVKIQGTEGVMHVGWKQSRYRLYRSQEWIPFGEPYNKLVAIGNQNRHFVECISGQSASLINEADGLESVRVVQAAYRALESGSWVDVASVTE